MKMSNRSIVLAFLGIIAVALFGAFASLTKLDQLSSLMSLTGAFGSPGATNYGATNITIQSTLEINFSDDEANFSSGRIRAGADSCQIGTEGQNSTGCQDFRVPSGGFILENTGNVNVRLNLSNTNFSSSFFTDTQAGYAIKIQVPEVSAAGEFPLSNPACNVTTPLNLSDPNNDGLGLGNFTGTLYTNLTTLNYPGNISVGGVLCGMFNASNSNDIINISILLFIRDATPASPTGGAKDLWTATAVSI